MDAMLWRILLSTTAFAAVLLLVLALAFGKASLIRLLERRNAQDRRALDELFLYETTTVELWIWVGIGCVVAGLVAYLFTDSPAFAMVVVLLVPMAPGPVLKHMREKRMERFDEQLPSVLDQLAASARSGLSLPQCIKEVATEGTPPAKQEFALIHKDMQLASGPRAALESARERIGSRSFNLVVSALSVSLERGGNLPEALDQISRSLRELWRLEQKLITASAEGRKAVRMITAMPILLFMLISSTQPELIDALVGDPLGWIVLIVAGLLYGVGYLWVRRMLAVSV